MRVVEKIDAHSCRTEAWPADFQRGDTLVLWDWHNKTERGEAMLTDAQKEPDGRWRLGFDRALDFITAGNGQPAAPHKVQEVDGMIQVHNTNGVTVGGNQIAPPAPGCPKVDPILVDTCRNVEVSP